VSERFQGRVAGLRRHPVKGFTPEMVEAAELEAGAHFPGDRMFAVEDGPCGFDAANPAHVPKMRFAVLARIPGLAAISTRYDDVAGVLYARHPVHGAICADMASEFGRAAFADWLGVIAGDDARGALRVLKAPGGHRFMDSRTGFVSIINLASVRDLEARLAKPLDPARFRGNILVEGWPAWCELALAGRAVSIGGAALRGIKPITRCTATHVNPHTAQADIDVVSALQEHYGHAECGLYAEVSAGGRIAAGDAACA